MIELVSQVRCVSCDICVSVCPTNVFDPVEGGPPVIARQADCQTCFLCEAYCPADALYVAGNAHRHVEVSEEDLIKRDQLGSYRKLLGWGKGRTPSTAEVDPLKLLFARQEGQKKPESSKEPSKS